MNDECEADDSSNVGGESESRRGITLCINPTGSPRVAGTVSQCLFVSRRRSRRRRRGGMSYSFGSRRSGGGAAHPSSSGKNKENKAQVS